MAEPLSTPARLSRFALVVYWITLFATTHIPGQILPKPLFQLSDLFVHYTAFSLLTFLLLCSFRSGLPQGRRLLLCAIVLGTYAAIDEYTQCYIPGRFASLRDWLADFLGVICVLGLMYTYDRVVHRRALKGM